MRCARHGLASGPDGRCALCRTRDRVLATAASGSSDPLRRVAVIVVALAALVAAYALITSVVDTRPAGVAPAREAGR